MNTIFTAIFNKYDQLREIKLEEGWRAICFTDQDIQSKSWEIRKREFRPKLHRDIKLRPHYHLPKYDKCVWIDGNLELSISLNELIKNRDGFWLMQHPDRNCLFKEAARCVELKKDDGDIIFKQIEKYSKEDCPINNGLSATGCLIRDWTNENIAFCELWWKEVKEFSVRDQISFPYVAWRTGLKFDTFPFLQGFQYHYHLHKIREMERAKQRRIENKNNRENRLRSRRTKEYYKRYGNNENGNNSATY